MQNKDIIIVISDEASPRFFFMLHRNKTGVQVLGCSGSDVERVKINQHGVFCGQNVGYSTNITKQTVL